MLLDASTKWTAQLHMIACGKWAAKALRIAIASSARATRTVRFRFTWKWYNIAESTVVSSFV